MRTRLLLLALPLALGACRSGGVGAAAAEPSRPHIARQRDVITADELATLDVENAYQAVQRLRPAFLQTRGNVSITQGAQPIVVYVDETRMGGPSALQQIPVNEVKEIRYLNSSDATQRYGTGHTSGAIVVTRR